MSPSSSPILLSLFSFYSSSGSTRPSSICLLNHASINIFFAADQSYTQSPYTPGQNWPHSLHNRETNQDPADPALFTDPSSSSQHFSDYLSLEENLHQGREHIKKHLWNFPDLCLSWVVRSGASGSIPVFLSQACLLLEEDTFDGRSTFHKRATSDQAPAVYRKIPVYRD